MAPIKIHGLVQIRSKNRNRHTRASQWKEAVIEIVERKQKVTMVFSFKLEKRKRVFQLGNNVAGVVVSCCEVGLHCLYLTLKGDTSLLIDKLSSEDIEQLKAFLDLAHLSDSQDPDDPQGCQDFLESRHAFCRKHQEPLCGSLNTAQERETPLPTKTPLSMSRSTSRQVKKERVEKEIKKRKRISTPSVEVDEDILTEYNPEPQKKYKVCTPRSRRGKGEKPMASREQEKHSNWKLENSLIASSRRKTNFDDTVLSAQTLSDERSGSKLSQETPACNEIQLPLDTYAKQLNREGFPNLGNTCYMNSILQSVFGIPTFAKDLLTQGIPWEKVSCDDLIKPLSQLLVLKDIRDVEIKGQLLMTVKKSISTVADTFLGDEQNDAHEFLSQCLEQLKLNMEKLNAMCSSERENEAATSKRFICPVAANFEIELHSSIVCEGCGEATVNTEVSNYLSVDLPQGTKDHPLSIQKSLDLFFTPEKIEHNCENCKNKNSVLRYTWRRLPRVLIVHLKRYHFTSNRMLVKSQQPVEISKFLNVSTHCNENTKPPFPVTNKAPNEEYDVSNSSEGTMHEIFGHSIPSMQPTSVSIDFTVLQVGSNEDSDVQNFQIMCDDQQQLGLEGVSGIDPELLKTEKWMLCENASPTWDSIICEPISFQDLGLREKGLQKLPENPEVQNYKKINVYGNPNHHTIIEICNNFCDLKEQRFLESTQDIGKQFLQHHGKRIQKELLPWALPQSVRGTQGDTGRNLSRYAEMIDPKGDASSLGASGYPGNSKVAGSDNPDAAGESNAAMEDDPQSYRLVGVVSHFGSSQDSGHYVSDVYDFQRQAWLLYSDVQVFEIPEALIQENRLHTGYIFFYMQNEIFEWLLKKASECRLLSTPKDEKKTMDLFSTLLNGFTYLLEES